MANGPVTKVPERGRSFRRATRAEADPPPCLKWTEDLNVSLATTGVTEETRRVSYEPCVPTETCFTISSSWLPLCWRCFLHQTAEVSKEAWSGHGHGHGHGQALPELGQLAPERTRHRAVGTGWLPGWSSWPCRGRVATGPPSCCGSEFCGWCHLRARKMAAGLCRWKGPEGGQARCSSWAESSGSGDWTQMLSIGVLCAPRFEWQRDRR